MRRTAGESGCDDGAAGVTAERAGADLLVPEGELVAPELDDEFVVLGREFAYGEEGIALDDPLRAHIQDKITATTGRGRLRPTSARVAFTDENGPKGGPTIRCAVTVEVPHRPTVHANGLGETPRVAFDAGLAALEHELERERGRRRDVARRPKKYYVASFRRGRGRS